jgi:type I restriction enzyme M protein
VNTPAEQITAADIARIAQVSAAAVSNWRRRHRGTFPLPERHDNRESFTVAEVAAWLDHRKIPANDLKEGELPGITYGMRFCKNISSPGFHPGAITSMLWRQAEAQRGFIETTVYGDLVLSLLYLRQRYPARWEEITAHAAPEPLYAIENVAKADEPLLTYLNHAISVIFSESDGRGRFAKIIRLLDSVLPSVGQDDRSTESAWAGEVFDHLLEMFANTQGKQTVVYTPRSVVHAMVELVMPQPGESVLDPCCESGGFLIDAARYARERGGGRYSVALVGRAPQERSWALARMNLTLHGLQAELGQRPVLALSEDMRHRQFDVILANPPFNLRDWGPPQPDDPRWRYGPPPKSNANFAWLQHIASCLNESGRAAVIMPNGASVTRNDQGIRAAMADDGVVKAVIALPSQLFASTTVPVNVWLLTHRNPETADEILFIDARTLGHMVSRTRRELSPADIEQILATLQEWLHRHDGNGWEDQPGFAASVPIGTVRDNDYMLLPGKYVGTAPRTSADLADVDGLRLKLDLLHARAAEADVAVVRQLDRLLRCTR